MRERETIQFRAVSAFVVCGRGAEARYLLLHRAAEYLKGNWQMVVGRMEKGETPAQAALREVREETGLAPSRLYNSAETEVFYHAKEEAVAVVPAFVAFVEKTDGVVLSPSEHDAYEWLSFEEALARLEFPQQKRVLESVHRHFILAEPSERLRIPL